MSDQVQIRIVVVDDHDMVRRGLAAYLKVQPDLSLIGEAGDGMQAVELCLQLQPDVVLMDLIMPGMGGIEATRLIREQNPATQVIALTNFQEKSMVQEAIRAGAISYLLKNVKGDNLAAAIRSANAGRGTLSPEVTQGLITSGRKPQVGQDLSPRELEVLALMVEGLTNPEIAERLSISRATASSHVSHILQKLDVSNRAEAIVLAVRNNLVE
ncbi:MAG TPA: response regulator transcription factor [Anaerolineales bacterium]|nr:response regulator transcription factor [Anaerolineales bacterium]